MGEISEVLPGSIKGLHLVVEYLDGIKFAYFSDPDGNSWALQEVPPDI